MVNWAIGILLRSPQDSNNVSLFHLGIADRQKAADDLLDGLDVSLHTRRVHTI